MQGDFPPETVRGQVDRIIASSLFARSGRLARFLRFTVEQVLAGRQDQLKEFVIGVEVFDRPTPYDPRIDPIVRVEARRLRKKLAEYYACKGGNDTVRIEFPKGGYAPLFCPIDIMRSLQPEKGTTVEFLAGIAVTPFVSLSFLPEDEMFCSGLSQQLLDTLTNTFEARVISVGGGVRAGQEMRRLGREFRIESLLEGSLRRMENCVRITARLIRLEDGVCTWSEMLERCMNNPFALQDEVSAAVVEAIRMGLKGSRVRERCSRDAQAYQLYRKGRFFWQKRTEDAGRKSIATLEDAVRRDPKYASAWSALAEAYVTLGKYGVTPGPDLMERGRAAALHALELDPLLAEPYVALGSVAAVHEWNWQVAEPHFLRALDLEPDYPTAHHWFGLDYLSPLGRLDEAIAYVRRAQELDPLSTSISSAVGDMLAMAREPGKAIEQYRKALELDAYFLRAHLGLGRTHAACGHYREAVAAFETAQALSPDSPTPIALLANANLLAGDREAGLEYLDRLEQMTQAKYVSPYLFARAYAGVDTGRAMGFLEQAFAQRDPRLIHLKASSVFDPLRGDPAFPVLLKRLGV